MTGDQGNNEAGRRSKKGSDGDGNLWRIAQWFPELGTKKIGLLKIFHSELILFNGKLNLISPRTEREADRIHFSDSILASRLLFAATKEPEIYDIGSGNGFPGVILAILAPDRQIVVVDSDARKLEFIKHVIGRTKLENISTIHTRIEDLSEEELVCGISRGFASIGRAVTVVRKVFKVGGSYFHMKGDSWMREVGDIPAQLCTYWSPSLVGYYDLPGEAVRHALVVTKKILD